MQTPSRAAPHLLLAMLTVLAVAAIVLSLDTAPPNAEQQLQQAAKDTVGASSFVLHDTITVIPGSGASASQARREVAEVVYRAPDQVRESVTLQGRTLTVLALGRARYERSGDGRWVSLANQPGTVPAGEQAAAGVVGPFQVITTATDVARHGDVFTFQPAAGQLSTILGDLLGAQGAQLPAASTTFAATLAGEYLHTFDLTASLPGGRVLVHLVLDSFDHAPVLVAPPAAAAP